MSRSTRFFLAVVFLLAASPRSAGAQEADVVPEDLLGLIERADRLVVRAEPLEGSSILFQSAKREDLDALRSALKLRRPEQWSHCLCIGSPAIELYSGAEKIGDFTNIGAVWIRSSLWSSDASVADAETLLRWFDARNLRGPRKEYEDALERERRWSESEKRWFHAMPSSLQPYWPIMRNSFSVDLEPLRKALATQVPDAKERILGLFAWFGSGDGPWSGHPSYESVAEGLLLEYPTAQLLAAIDGVALSGAQTEGVARLFGGWSFWKSRPEDLSLLPAELRRRLLQHSLASADEDKRQRAQSAFGERRN
jgi:hypothetical protein